MLITGAKKRSIADQTGVIDFRFLMSFSNTTGECLVGLSGTRTFNFAFRNGKIYDNAGNFVQSYSPSVPVLVSGQLGQRSYDYAINDELIALDNPIDTGMYSWLFVKPTNMEVEFDGFVRGAVPNYYADNAGKYYHPNYIVSGRIINLNPSSTFRIFDVEVLQPSSPFSVYDFTATNISGTGYIQLTSDQIGLSDYVVPLLLRTNFGDVPLDFTITGDYTVVPDVYLNISPDTVNVVNGVAKNYLAQFAYFPTGAYIALSLEYLSGTTGNIYFFKDQISDIQYRLLSGLITGCGQLADTRTGLVSGQDPKTLIYEQGTGTGVFTSETVCATGDVSQDYNLQVFGLGAGFFNVNYLASGFGSGMFSGIVPVSGGWLTIVGYNFTGTGDNPGVAVGFVPTGTGRYFARPTGCLTISQTLVYDTDFFSGNLALDVAYAGPLVINYSVLGVGWATGAFVSGRVDSRYVLNFEQGQYTYTKFYSGLVSGRMTNTGNFDPATQCLGEELGVTGILTGNFSLTAMLDCSVTTGLPFIPITGVPIQIFDSQKRLVQPNRVVMIQPSGGFGTSETSYNALGGQFTRTKTSRMGSTPSGEGYFQNPVGECLAPGNIESRIWKESMPYTTTSGTFDAVGNSVGFVSTRMYLTGTGELDQDISGAQDSGVIHFFISGSGKKAVAFRGMNFSQPDRILHMVLMKDGVFYNSWEDLYIDPKVYSHINTATNGTNAYDTIGLTELSSGYYSLYISAREATAPSVYFQSAIFSGCESARHLIVTVEAQGVFRENACVDLVDYVNGTARSGANYDPIYIRYTDTGLLAEGGCRSIAGGGGQAKECPGICFEAAYTSDEDFRWYPEVRTYTFTIPIYDNAYYGNDPEFTISLTNPSGCQLGFPSEATIRILENDNPIFVIVTGVGESGEYLNGILSGITEFDCIPETEVEPEPPDPCIFDPSFCDPCYTNPANCEEDPPTCTGFTPPPCCSCGSTTSIAGTCPGYGTRIFSGIIPTPGGICGQVSAGGCGPTNGQIFVGKLCCSGSSLSTSFAGHCLQGLVSAFPEDCITNEDACEDAGDHSWSGCNGMNNCTGECGPSGCAASGNFSACPDYGVRIPGKRRPRGPDCNRLLVFLEVIPSSSPNCAASSHTGCSDWDFTGTCYGPRGGGMGLVCPPPP